MKNVTLLAVTVLFVVVTAGAALAVPRLQTYIVGSTYHDFYRHEFQSWITNNSSFDMKVVGYWDPASQGLMLRSGSAGPGLDYMDCFLMASIPHEQAGTIWINGVEMTGFGGYYAGIPEGVHPSPSLRYHMPILIGGGFAFQSIGRIDLKNTTGMLSLVAENARVNIGSAKFQKDALETIRRSVDNIQRLITSLNVHKMPPTLSKAETDVAPLVERATNDLKQVASKAGVALEFMGGVQARMRIDTAAIGRGVENLVLNAVEAAGSGGSVRVMVETVDDTWVRISVTDTGPGFDPDYLKSHLFHPFYSTKKQGLGVGLIMCKSLVEADGGRIAVKSVQGRGAMVSVTLPAAPPARSE